MCEVQICGLLVLGRRVLEEQLQRERQTVESRTVYVQPGADTGPGTMRGLDQA